MERRRLEKKHALRGDFTGFYSKAALTGGFIRQSDSQGPCRRGARKHVWRSQSNSRAQGSPGAWPQCGRAVAGNVFFQRSVQAAALLHCRETHTPGSTQCCRPRALRLHDWGLWSPTLSQEVPLALGRIHFHLGGGFSHSASSGEFLSSHPRGLEKTHTLVYCSSNSLPNSVNSLCF